MMDSVGGLSLLEVNQEGWLVGEVIKRSRMLGPRRKASLLLEYKYWFFFV
jgi:hypothetical protein